MNFLCLVGLHKFDIREIHCEEKPASPIFKSCIMSHCSNCKMGKIMDKTRDTKIIFSKKYSGEI